MKNTIVGAACSMALVLGSATLAAAQDVTFTFTGTISRLENNPLPDIEEGTPVTGSYTFNLSTPDTNAMAQVGDYWHNSSPYGVIVQIGSHTFRTNPSDVEVIVEILDDYYGDSYLMRSYRNLPTDAGLLDYIEWVIQDPSETALDSVALSAVPPDLTRFNQMFGFTVVGAGSSFMIRGSVTQRRTSVPSCSRRRCLYQRAVRCK